MKHNIETWLKIKLDDRKAQLKGYGYDGRAYRHWQPDLEYAEWEIVENLIDEELWDGYENSDEILTSSLFQETVFIQACANMMGF